ncbi:MAG TPA: hypothetical protein VMN39_02755 [Longimicrobiaceae bacterium]|nr:hypothetical protein [Longimicrobiaceae bacterium]
MNRPQPTVLDEALEVLQRKRFFETLNHQYTALRADAGAWAEAAAERRMWDQTSSDSAAE